MRVTDLSLPQAVRFEVRATERLLLIDGAPAKLGARAFDVLQALYERRERVVTKNELFEIVWPGVVVEENNLQVQISTLRKLLGPNAIATVPGRGYQFTATGLVGGRAIGDRTHDAVPVGPPAAAKSTNTVGNLPDDLPPLYGRAGDLATLRALVDQHRLVSIVGAAGTGKTALTEAFLRRTADCWQASRIVDSGLVDLSDIVSQRFPLKEAAAAFAAAPYTMFVRIRAEVETYTTTSSYVIASGQLASLTPFFRKFIINADQWDGYRTERHEILATIEGLPADVTVLLIEHDMDLVFSFADRISVLVYGRVLATGTPSELMERTGTRDLEGAFVALLPPEKRGDRQTLTIPRRTVRKA